MQAHLQHLLTLSAAELHEEARRARLRLAESEWAMGVCLLALERGDVHRQRGCSSVVQYAVSLLDLDDHKASELLRNARALENLPEISEAFRLGKLGWGKVRELTRVVTADTEKTWLAFALGHSTGEVRHQVALSPREWKKAVLQAHRAATAPELFPAASQQGATTAQGATTPPGATAPPPKAVPAQSQASVQPASGKASPLQPTLEGLGGTASHPAKPADAPVPAPLPGPKLIKVEMYFTPEQFAVWEQSERIIRSRHRKPMRRNEVGYEFALAVQRSTSSQIRARYQVVVHVDAQTGVGWYETERGVLMASPEKVQEALAEGDVSIGDGSPAPPKEPVAAGDSAGKRSRHLSVRTVRALYARSGGKCEVPGCGRTHSLQVHHLVPFSRGGGNDLEGLELRCLACHSLGHQKDYEQNPGWRAARARRLKGRKAAGG